MCQRRSSFRLLLVLLSACGTPGSRAGGTGFGVQPGHTIKAAQELRQLQAQWRQALSARDTAFFQKVIADDFVITGGATTETKAGFIRELASSNAAVAPAHLEETNIRVFDDFAVLTGLIRYDIPGSAEPVRSRYTEVWVKRNGRWLSLHSHHNPLTAP